MGFIASIFGAKGPEPAAVEPLPEPEPEEDRTDPNRDAEISEATKMRKAILARRGRSSLVSSRDDGQTRSGVSVRS